MYIWMLLFTLGIVAADQLSKLWILNHIALYDHIPAIPGLFRLTYVQNTGAAFSMLEGRQWVFLLVFLLFTGIIIYDLWKKKLPFTTLERWCIAAIYAGGVGNLIDRLRFGYVVDMIETEFIQFPVFNVADSFITCGCILLLVHLFLFNKGFWKDEKQA